MAPEELHPPRETLIRAGQWLVKQVENMDLATVDKNYTFLTHVGRSLALWRGQFAAEAQKKLGRSEPLNFTVDGEGRIEGTNHRGGKQVMKTIFRLWRDEQAFVQSTELILVARSS